MKVLVNHGLNLSELDGWWAEAYRSDADWALEDGREHTEPKYDAAEVASMYEILERHVVPEYYNRDHANIHTYGLTSPGPAWLSSRHNSAQPHGRQIRGAAPPICHGRFLYLNYFRIFSKAIDP